MLVLNGLLLLSSASATLSSTLVGTEYVQYWGVDHDASGASYTSGVFKGSVTMTVGGVETTYTSPAGVEFSPFVFKNAGGSVEWFTMPAAGLVPSWPATQVAVEKDPGSNYLFLGGGVSTTYGLQWRSDLPAITASNGLYVAKLAKATGAVEWVRVASSTSNFPFTLAAQRGTGRVVVTGELPCNGHNLIVGSTTLTCGGRNWDMFLFAINGDSTDAWAFNAGFGGGGARGTGVTSDASGNLFVGGDYGNAALTLGGLPALPASGQNDGYLAKFNADGVPQWSVKFGDCSGDDRIYQLELAGDGDIVVVGHITGTSVFLGQTYTTTPSNFRDGMVAKYSAADGSEIWAKQVSSDSHDHFFDLGIAAGGKIHVAGVWNEDDFEVTTSDGSVTTLPRTGNSWNAMAIELEADGTLASAMKVGTDNTRQVWGNAVSCFSDCLTVGRFQGTATFDDEAGPVTAFDTAAFGVVTGMASGGGQQDPHLTLAHGGKADFRGTDKGLYNFLSAKNVSLNVMTELADFHLRGVLVHGSFMTQAHVVAMTRTGRTVHASYWAEKIGNRNVGWMNGTIDDLPAFSMGAHGQRQIDDVTLSMDYSSLHVVTREFEIVITPQPVYGHVAGPTKRLDVQIKGRMAEAEFAVPPHGIIGQSWDRDLVAVNGKQDVYPMAGEFTTSAMAEGAIEGVAKDYMMPTRYATAFKYSRFGVARALPRNVNELAGMHATASLSDGAVGSEIA